MRWRVRRGRRAGWRAAALVALTGVAAVLAAPPARAEAAVTGVRVSQHRGFTRLTLTLTAPVRFRAATAGAPYRLVLELERVEWRLSPVVALGDGLVASLRYEAAPDGPSRVVAALRGPARVQKTFALRPRRNQSWRLVVDLERISKDAFERLHGARERRATVHLVADRTAETRHRDRAKRAQTGDVRASAIAGPDVAPLIVLDPGHGGKDSGAVSPWGLQEKSVVLRFARILRGALLRTGRYRVLMTRHDDTFLPLRRRYEVASRARADLFMSIHANSNPYRRMRGLSVYTLSARASDRLAAAMAHHENRADEIAGVNLEDKSDPVSGILIDLVRRETMLRSLRFARLVVKEAGAVTRLLIKPHRSAGFVVLKAPDVPSVLVELGVLTNRADESKLRHTAYLRRVAAAMVRAIDRFFAGRRRQPQTAVTKSAKQD